MLARVFAICALLLTYGPLRAPAQTAPALPSGNPGREPRVTTFAGSGVAGFADGPAADAQFLFPTALAADAAGNIYVADTGAQRIRIIGANGTVRTLAGSGPTSNRGLWVAGGYRDGAGAQAQLAAPSGLAFVGDVLYVSDTYSATIRKIDRDGSVSTFAGTAFSMGKRDGPRAAALFAHPVGMAADSHGNIFVADVENGIRRIDPAGTVTTEDLPVDHPLSVAIHESAQGETLFVADSRGILVRFPNGVVKRIIAPIVQAPNAFLEGTQGGMPIGYPVSISAIDDDRIVYADSRTHTVRLLDVANTVNSLPLSSYARVLGGQATDSAAQTSGAFRDGAASQSYFDAPMGVMYYHGDVLVADSGNKRIRRITGIDLREPVNVTTEAIPAACSRVNSALRVALVGNSYIWWDTDWSSSIPGLVEDELNDGLPAEKRVTVTPFQMFYAPFRDAVGYVELLADLRCYRAVVFVINSGSIDPSLGATPQEWEPRVTSIFQEANAKYRAAGIPLIVVAIPNHFEAGPSEATWLKMPQAALTPFDWSEPLQRSLNDSGINNIGLWSAFATEIKSPAHQALFGSDAHLTPHARALVAAAVARLLREVLHRR